MNVKKFIVFSFMLCAVFFFLGKELNPLDPRFFTIHDSTQGARMQEFAFNLQNGIIPPRLAPHFSFQHGFPVFNFYAPFSYWVGGLLHLVGFSSALSLKMVLFFGLLGSFISFFLFVSLFTGFWGGILGASVYSSSLWMAVEIFVRGNGGEVWFMALFPLALYALKQNDAMRNGRVFFFTSIVLSFLFTAHNVLSLISVGFVLLFSLLLKHKKEALLSVLFGLLLSAYFLFPALLETSLTYAKEVASKTHYSDHFLCGWQLWSAQSWSFGGSGVGCYADDMSFQIGKLHLILAAVGCGVAFSKKKLSAIPRFILVFGILSAFLTTYASSFIWKVLSPLIAVFQFPWRFLPFVVFSVAFIAAYTTALFKKQTIQASILLMISVCILFTSSKFFTKPWLFSLQEYSQMTLSDSYIASRAAYEIPEYFPRYGDYTTWRSYSSSSSGFPTTSAIQKEGKPFYKEFTNQDSSITLPLHYFPFWTITINGNKVIPRLFDSLGRPILTNLSPQSEVIVRYNETPIEKAGNYITVIAFITLIFVMFKKNLWNKPTHTHQ